MRKRVRFARHNLLSDMAPLGQFDLISCQDVLPGFNAETRGDVALRRPWSAISTRADLEKRLDHMDKHPVRRPRITGRLEREEG